MSKRELTRAEEQTLWIIRRTFYKKLNSIDPLMNRQFDVAMNRIIEEVYSPEKEKYELDTSRGKIRNIYIFMRDQMHDIIKKLVEDGKETARLVAVSQLKLKGYEPFDVEEFLGMNDEYGSGLLTRLSMRSIAVIKQLEILMQVAAMNGYDKRETFLMYQETKDNLEDREEIKDAIISGVLALKDIRKKPHYWLRLVVEDTTLRGYATANKHYWQRAGGKIIVAEKDGHVCENCQALDGMVFLPHEDVIPVHPSCRCIEVPFVGGNGVIF